MRVLNRKFLLRYLILIAVLAVCAGAVWYRTSMPGPHAADTVLAKLAKQEKIPPGFSGPAGNYQAKYVMLRERIPAKYAVLQRSVPTGYFGLHGDPEGASL